MVARVVTDRLRVRSEPGVTDSSIRLEPLLDAGLRAYVVDGPVAATGYQWYLIVPLLIPGDEQADAPSGWVAGAAKTGEAWLAPESFECPALTAGAPPWSAFGAGTPPSPFYWGLICYGGEEVTFTARLGTPEATCGVEEPWGIEPRWFDACRQDPHFLLARDASWDGSEWPTIFDPAVSLSIAAPSGSYPEEWPFVEVRGLFDHPAAVTCRSVRNYDDDEPYEGERTPDPGLVALACRGQFVVTAIRERSERVALIRNGSVGCEGGALDGYGIVGDGVAVIDVASPGEVSAQVVLRRALPNASYNVQLIQPDGIGETDHDCFVIDATLVTDGAGDGRASLQEPRRADAIGAFVYLYHLSDAAGPLDLHGTRLVQAGVAR